jgi:superfamily II DNA or RNA helicase
MDYTKISKFNDVYSQTKNLTKKQKGDFFEEFTYHLFKSDPKINNGLENIWLYSDVPRKIIKELCLPTKDKGIDLLAKINGDYYAIQCKFRQNSNAILNWTELSTFFGLAFGMNNKIKGGFLVTNTTDLCKEVIKSTKVEPIYGDYFDDLPKNFFKYFHKSIPTYVQKFPFNYQSKCKLSCLVHFVDHNRGHIEMACGSGKTLTSYWIDTGLSNKRTVIFVPSLYLLSQFYSDWVNQSYAEQKQIKYLLVGSDADVDEDVKYKSNGLILHTDPKSIKKFIKNTNEKLVVISTYQSSDKLEAACDSFDFGIFDEAHKTVGQSNKKFTQMLTDKHVTIKKRLFMTATPKMYSGDLDNEKIISMDNEKFYGAKLYTYNTGNAIQDKKLVDYQVVSIYAKNSSIEKSIRKNKLVKLKQEFDEFEANYLATILVLLKKIKDGTCRHLITYHNKVESARKFSEYLDIIHGKIYDDKLFIWHLSGKTSMGERNRIIKEFVKSECGILCSARVLNEGVNIPIVDSVCFVDARFSTIDIVQCIGRSLRLFNGKTMAHVIVPTFIKDFNEDLDKDAYGNVIRILKALKTTDDGVVEYFKMRKSGKKYGRQIVAGEYFDDEVYAKEIDLDKWCDVVGEKVWQMVDGFAYVYEQLKKWIEINKRLPSQHSNNETEKFLGRWCVNKRQDKRRDEIKKDHIVELEKISKWYWNRNDDIFDKKYDELTKWIEKNGRMPRDTNDNIEEKNLSMWCQGQRKYKNKNKMNKKNIKKLEQIYGWYWNKFDDGFNDSYNELKQWVKRNNKLPSRNVKDPIENKLSVWCGNKRINKRNGILTEEQKKKLEKIPGWYWGKDIPKKTRAFEEVYDELKKWVDNNSKLPNRNSRDKTERKLGTWCDNKRFNMKKNILNSEEIVNLEKISGWFWRKDDPFDKRYNELKEWINNNNRLPSSSSGDQYEKSLGYWCSDRRKNKKQGKLSEYKIKKMKKIPGWFWSDTTKIVQIKTFNERYNELKKWIRKNKKLPKACSKDRIEKSLGYWCSDRRKNKQQKKLSDDKIKALEKLPGWYWSENQKKYSGSKTSSVKS